MWFINEVAFEEDGWAPLALKLCEVKGACGEIVAQ